MRRQRHVKADWPSIWLLLLLCRAGSSAAWLLPRAAAGFMAAPLLGRSCSCTRTGSQRADSCPAPSATSTSAAEASEAAAANSFRTGASAAGRGDSSCGVKRIFILGQDDQRAIVTERVAEMCGWHVVDTTRWGEDFGSAVQTIESEYITGVVVSCHQGLVQDEQGARLLAGQIEDLVVSLVGPGDTMQDVLAIAPLSRFDVAVGRAVGAPEAAAEVLRLAATVGSAVARDEGLGITSERDELFLDMGHNTFFLSLTYKDVRECLASLPGLERGVSALELRVDLLEDQSPWSVLAQVALLKARSRLPVIFTVRSRDQCGAFPDEPDPMFDLLALGLRAGVDVLDVEACWPRPYRDRIIGQARERYRGMTRVLGSYHVVGKPVSDDQARAIFQECYHDGAVDAVKVVLTAMSVADSYRVHELAASLKLPCPVIALCLGEKGKLSRVLNSRYTPVTSALLPSVAAPGQVTADQIMRLRQDLGMVPPRSFYLLGTPIQQSPSPAMHNAAFGHCALPHRYSLFETADVAEFAAAVLRTPEFGGASVTIPHKQAVVPLLDRVTPAAEAVGAVNTIIPRHDPATGNTALVGDNTDWLGILRPVSRELRRAARSTRTDQRVGLVVGGGGTALAASYALAQLGLRLVVYNRTPSKAHDAAQRFGGTAVDSLDQVDRVDVVVSTIPAAAGFTLPPHLLASRPVVMDVAYRPAETQLLAQAKAAGCPRIQGAEMLIGQGVEQFQLWTERRAPEDVMRTAVYSTVESIT